MASGYGVDLVLGMRPFHYLSSTANFRRLAERLGSKRLKAQWAPADTQLQGERDVATAGFENVRPHLYSLHLKDVHIFDGPSGKFEWRPLGEGMVDYPTVLRNLRAHRCPAILGLATHFLPASGSRVEAMQTNFANLQALIGQL